MATFQQVMDALLGVKRFQRNMPATGAATAAQHQGPMLYHDLWGSDTFDATNSWGSSVAATGGVAVGNFANGTGLFRALRMNCPAAGGGDIARAWGLKGIGLPLWATALDNSVYNKLTMEWSCQFGASGASIDNAVTFMGLGTGQPSIRTTADIGGFIFVSDAINTITDLAGTETLTVPTGVPAITVVNKYKMILGPGATIGFYINNVLMATHTTNLPGAQVVYPAFSMANDAGGANSMRVGPLRIWMEES